MEKITLTKIVKYYNKNTLYNSEITEKNGIIKLEITEEKKEG